MNTEFYFWRHVKTSENVAGVISGQSDSRILVNQRVISDVDIKSMETIYSSTMSRCRDTLGLMGYTSAGIMVRYDSRLIERCMGDYEGGKKCELIKAHPESFSNGMFDVFQTPPNGESYKEFRDRVHQFYEECLANAGCGRILVCSHNQVLKMLRIFILGKEVSYESWSEWSALNGVVEKIGHI